MSEDKAVRSLNQAVELAKQRIYWQQNDIEIYAGRCEEKDKEILELHTQVKFEKAERLSLEKKSDTSLLFMFLFGCMTAVAIAYAILNCQ